MKVKNKLSLCVYAVVLGPSLIVCAIAGFGFDFYLRTKPLERLRALSTLEANHVEFYLHNATQNMRAVGEARVIQTFLRDNNAGSSESEKLLPAVFEILYQLCHTRTSVDAVGVYNKAGRLVASSGEVMPSSLPTDNRLSASGSDKVVFIPDDFPQSFVVGVPLYDEKNEYIGNINILNNMNLIRNQILQSIGISGGEIFILNHAGDGIVFSHNRYFASVYDLSAESEFYQAWETLDFTKDSGGVISYLSVDGEKKYASYTLIPGSDWVVFYSRAQAFMFTQRMTLYLLIGGCMSFVLLLATWLSGVATRVFYRNLNVLLGQLERLKYGDYTHRLNYPVLNEFGMVVRAFNRLLDRLMKTQESLEENAVRSRIVLDQTDNVLFELNPFTNRIIRFLTSPHYNRSLQDNSTALLRESEVLCPLILNEAREIVDQIATTKTAVAGDVVVIRANGLPCHVHVSLTPLPVEVLNATVEEATVLGIITDITEEKMYASSLVQKSRTDLLSNLLNRQSLEEVAEAELIMAREAGNELYVLFVDIDKFKYVNDTYGHAVGDRLIEFVGSVIHQVFDTVGVCLGRFGGDEFVIILRSPHMTDSAIFDLMLRGMLAQFQECLASGFAMRAGDGDDASVGTCINVTCSIGISVYPKDGVTLADLFVAADAAMYEVKHSGALGMRYAYSSALTSPKIKGER